jgi:hypothetical protein
MISYADAPLPEKLPLSPGRQPLPQRWGQGAAVPPEAGLHWNATGHIVFCAGMKPSLEDLDWRGQPEFTAGLWRRNVVECFLGNPENGHYLEMHLAPNGQWWACVFTGVRQAPAPAGHPLPLSEVEHCQQGGNWWQATVQVPGEVVCGLLGARSFFSLRGNLCAVHYPTSGSGPEYFSLAALPGPKPDFHQPDFWLPLQF